MPWFFSKRSKPDDKTIALWVGSIRTSADRQQFQAFLKQNQQNLMDVIAAEVLPLTGETNGEVAYLLVHFFSGRASLSSFKDVLDLHPESSRKAAGLFKMATERGLSDALKYVSVFTCSLEITNECKERHYAESLVIANHGIELWPDVGELWRQRGVVKIAQGDYDGALADLTRAKELNPEMLWLNEPIAATEKLLSSERSDAPNTREVPNTLILVPPGYGKLVRKALKTPLKARFANDEGMMFAEFRAMSTGVELKSYFSPSRSSPNTISISFGVGTLTEGELARELMDWAINLQGRAEYERRKREVAQWGMKFPEPVSKNNNFELTVRLPFDAATAEKIPVITPTARP